MTAQQIRQSTFDSLLFKHVGGPSRPDFVGRGLIGGVNFDITTPAQVNAHLVRPNYGPGLRFGVYERPPEFTVFP